MSGQHCLVDGIQGMHLSDRDHYFIMDTCSSNGLLPRSPNAGSHILLTESGVSVSWSPIFPTVAGGQCRLCWCASGFTCSISQDFAVDVGAVTVLGPSPLKQDRTCVAGQDCDVIGFVTITTDSMVLGPEHVSVGCLNQIASWYLILVH